ncbi:hypothetical protein B0T25DRAFT_540969, partial [Lasiosphaeria hispida]
MGLNLYLSYKRDTGRLIYWIVKASNGIISQAAMLPHDVPCTPNPHRPDYHRKPCPSVQAHRQIPLATPPDIFQMFCSVIDARTTSYRNFQSLVAERPDPKLKKSKASHLYFISVLTEAFKALSGTNLYS